jgi:hypothetical protein
MLETLDEMGTEALEKGPYGLRFFPTYAKEYLPEQYGRNAAEVVIIREIVNRLSGKRVNGHSIVAVAEKAYHFGGRCDLVVNVRDLRVWVECKSAWKKLLNGDFAACNRKRWTEDKWRDGVWDIVDKDVPKLNKLGPVDATHVAVFLFGFDHTDDPFDIRALYESLRLNELAKPPWIAAHGQLEGIVRPDRYPVRARNGCRERFWFWYCRTEGNVDA